MKENLQQGQRLFPSTGLILATVLRLEILAFFLQKNVVTRTGSEEKSLNGALDTSETQHQFYTFPTPI